MSIAITGKNLKMVFEQNQKIKDEISNKVLAFEKDYPTDGSVSREALALQILKDKGLILVPIEDEYFGGAIYYVDGKVIPVLNTARPRVNQNFAAWHELYHLLYPVEASGNAHLISGIPVVGEDNQLDERKADCFAARMLLSELPQFYRGIATEPNYDFLSAVCLSMNRFHAPYKAVLVQLYEEAVANGDAVLAGDVAANFDLSQQDVEKRFDALGLDSVILNPSRIAAAPLLEKKIEDAIRLRPDLELHKDNREFFERTIKECKEKRSDSV